MTNRIALLASAIVLMLCPAAPAAVPPVRTALQGDLAAYLASRGKAEHISVASLSVSLRDRSHIDAVAGTTAYGGSTPATTDDLFQIGSNTKAFTAVLMLQLEAAHKLSMDQTLGDWLPHYAAWKSVRLAQLLDMTSGIETYDGTRACEDAMAASPYRYFSPQRLIGFVDPSKPLYVGYRYSNTGYELAQLIIEKASGTSYSKLLQTGVIAAAGLHATYYHDHIYPQNLRDRTVAGYYYDTSASAGGLKPLVRKDVRDFSLSWAQAAGGIIATPRDLTIWARDLYQGPMLTAAQRAQLEALVSMKTGKPIARVTPEDPSGFGLGVAQIYKPGLGTFWFYEGETLGYRMVHAYFPANDVVIAVGVNSQPAKDEDQIGRLVQTIYQTLERYKLL